jgi:hypothetical protein
MKLTRIYLIVIIILGLALTFLYRQINKLETRLNHLENADKQAVEQHDIELVSLMSYNQRFIEKLYFAGENQNWPLASFYHHELEEIFEEIIEANIEEDGFDISNLSKNMIVPVLNSLKQSISNEDIEGFRNNYLTLVNNCNACHAATRHGFLKITLPERNSTTNQQF